MINEVVDHGAGELARLALTVEGITVVNALVKTVILQVQKTPEQRRAFTRIFDLSDRAGSSPSQRARRTAAADQFRT